MPRTRAITIWLAGLLLAVAVAPAPPASAAEIKVGCDVAELRNAIFIANPNDVLVLKTGCVYTLSGAANDDSNVSGDLDISGGTATPLTIRGGGPRMTIIDGGAVDRVFDIAGPRTVTIEDLTIRNGDATTNTTSKEGGGLFVGTGVTVTLRNATISGNKGTKGGGIMNNGGTLTLERVTLSGNSATSGEGGGVHNATGTATLTNVTVAQNSASLDGGGIFHGGTGLTLTNSTIAGNTTAAPEGGGLSGGATATTNTILAGNTAAGSVASDCLGNPGSQGNNLVQTTTGCTGLVGSDLQGQDPVLGTLQNNGGGTDTLALGATSPAIDTGAATGCPATDQRSRPRPGGAACDIGAVEFTPTIFTDVPESHFAWAFVEDVFTSGVTAGCTTAPLRYCPEDPVTRAQMAVFLLKAVEGPGFTPPACGTATFTDVPCSDLFAPWIYELANRGITAGCAPGLYCPTAPVTREQMAVFLLKTLEGVGFTPPDCTTPAFGDVPCGGLFAPWVNELALRTITGGCGAGNYCPGNPVTRAQMAIFLVRTFNLP